MRLNLIRFVRVACMAMVVAWMGACIDSEPVEIDSIEHHATSITADQATYAPGQQITLTWGEMPGNQTDWIAIATAGSGPTAGFQRYAFINGQVAGSMSFAGLPVGNYEARAYVNNTYTVIAQSTFNVADVTSTTTITTNKTMYGPGESVVVTWTNLPGNANDWIAINMSGSPPNAGFVRYAYVGGQMNGTMTFNGLAAGSYEARAYFNNTYNVLATSPTFTVTDTVANASIQTDKTAYSAGEVVTVTWNGLPGSTTDWIAIYPAGSPDNSQATQWQYTNGAMAGSFQFSGLPAGSYQARAYANNTFTVVARSLTFTVAFSNACNPSGQRPVLQGVQTGELTIGATETSASAALSVPLGQSILFSSVRENEPSPRHGAVQCDLHGDISMGPAAGVTCYRNTAGTDFAGSNGSITIRWTVATFSSGVTVQRGIAAVGTGTTVSISAVDTSQSFVLLGGNFNTGSGWGNNEFVNAQLSSSSLSLRTNVAGTDVPWQVVSVLGASVQRGTASLGSAATDVAVTISNAPAGTIAVASYTTDNASGIAAAAMMLDTQLVDPTTLAFHRGAGGSNLDISWEVISLPFATASGVSNFSTGQTNSSHGVPGLVGASSVVLAGSQAINGQSVGSTTFAGADLDIVGEGQATLAASNGLVTVQRAASQASASISWSAIDFSRDCTGF